MTDFGNCIKLCKNPTHVLVGAGEAHSVPLLDCELNLWQEQRFFPSPQSVRSKIWPNEGWLEQINAINCLG
jgi:hypothetical protein